jgi:hypothetical protein
MKCEACDVILSTKVSVRRFKVSKDFVNLCNKCLSTISDEVEVIEGKTEEQEENEYE